MYVYRYAYTKKRDSLVRQPNLKSDLLLKNWHTALPLNYGLLHEVRTQEMAFVVVFFYNAKV